ncbi:hypothetical protein B1690_04830 [Geobacillus sp. 46C-IIa]|uniref:transporter suffix domain-containing protein n=1 Tax=Geobacillus sp. 46C-IIa TaxID=1963025 RepID=UPI0009BE7A25|nr:transporter suffix domain-containing protein [Geobacillus sp. 46C-IIa]OQP07220.1 hypothetical protein B1690_04830 [Geobacillus sp. 46C-IIa]QNU29545.1 transporter suffix domain-containing protein [Geobacillus sp. 46C-IIa]
MKQKPSARQRVGVGLIIASFVVWIVPPIAPFLPLSASAKVLAVTIAVVMAEILFWAGAWLVGKEAAAKLKKYWNPKRWRIKRRRSDQTNDVETDGERQRQNE